MTREEAIKHLLHDWIINLGCDFAIKPGRLDDFLAALDVALSALHPVSREQVEKMRGEWIDCDGRKVPVDKYGQPCGWAKCSACGEYLTASDEYPCIGHFCPACGSPMTDKAVETIMKRMEEMRNG